MFVNLERNWSMTLAGCICTQKILLRPLLRPLAPLDKASNLLHLWSQVQKKVTYSYLVSLNKHVEMTIIIIGCTSV